MKIEFEPTRHDAQGGLLEGPVDRCVPRITEFCFERSLRQSIVTVRLVRITAEETFEGDGPAHGVKRTVLSVAGVVQVEG